MSPSVSDPLIHAARASHVPRGWEIDGDGDTDEAHRIELTAPQPVCMSETCTQDK